MKSFNCKGYWRTPVAAVKATAIAAVWCATGVLSTSGASQQYPQSASQNSERIVDCLLPGRIHSLGGRMYQTPPRPDRIPALECEIRGGDFLVYDRANIETSLAWWVDIANDGDADAMRYVGEIFERGLGGEPNYDLAASWYAKAAAAGNVPAKISLAQLYKSGQGVEQDTDRAKQLYAEAFGGGETISIDPRSITGPNNDMTALQGQIDEQQDEISRLSLELYQSQQRLAAASDELDTRMQRESTADETIERLSNEVERARSATASNEDQLRAAQERSQQLEDLRRELRLKEQETSRLEELLAYSEDQVDTTRSRLEEVEAEAEQFKLRLEQERETTKTPGTDTEDAAQRLAEVEQAYLDQQQLVEQLRRQSRTNEIEATRYRQMLADLEAQHINVELLTAEVQEREVRISQLEQLTSESSSQLDAAQRELDSQRQKAEAAERALIVAREQAQAFEQESAIDDEELARVQSLAAEREQNLTAQRLEMARLNEEIERVRQEAEAYKIQLDDMESKRAEVQADLVGPTIEIIDPSLMATRGFSVNSTTASLISTQPQRPLVGRVTAPAGLLSLTVNNVPTEANDRGVFKTIVDVVDPGIKIDIVAIDEQGKRATKSIEFTTPVARSEPEPINKNRRFNVAFGNYHALLIGNNKYENFQDLKTPINDVNAIEEVLREKYGFKTTVLHDATNKQIFQVLYEDLLPNLTSEDNLLIYYAGHGDYIDEWESYTWLPVDAEKDNPQNYFWNDDLAKYLKTMSAKQILVIADSCYSGALTRDASVKFSAGKTDAEYERWLKKWSQKPARIALTSGGMRPVLDAGGGKHSVFAKALLDVLNENSNVLPSQDLGQQVGARVSYAAEELDFKQEPEWAPINFTGHEGGDFFFVNEL